MMNNKRIKQIEVVKLLLDTLNAIDKHTEIYSSSKLYEKAFTTIEEELVCALTELIDEEIDDE